MTGCSAHQNDSNPSSSAAFAIAPGSTQYAGSGTDTPTFIASASPDVAGDVDDTLQLAPLLVLRQRVPVMRARESALRRQAQPFERHVLGRLVDPAPQRVLRLQRARLRRDQPQHDFL